MTPGRAEPSHVLFIPTYRCNLRCPYCLVFEPVRYWRADPAVALPAAEVADELTTEQVLERVIPECEALGVQVFAITGGEIMLRRDIGVIFERLGRSPMAWCIDSNLSRCTPELAVALVAAGCETVFVSIDGDEATHNAVRANRFAFHQATRGLRNVIDAKTQGPGPGPRLVLNCVLQAGNETAPPDVVDIAAAFGADGVAFQLLSKYSYANETFDSRSAIAALGAARTKAEATGVDVATFPLTRPTVHDLDEWFAETPSAQFFNGCSYVESSLRIDPAGNVIPCVENRVGNVVTHSLREIWEGQAYDAFREQIHQEPLSSCQRCCNMTA